MQCSLQTCKDGSKRQGNCWVFIEKRKEISIHARNCGSIAYGTLPKMSRLCQNLFNPVPYPDLCCVYICVFPDLCQTPARAKACPAMTLCGIWRAFKTHATSSLIPPGLFPWLPMTPLQKVTLSSVVTLFERVVVVTGGLWKMKGREMGRRSERGRYCSSLLVLHVSVYNGEAGGL